jgi:hypothetical protein
MRQAIEDVIIRTYNQVKADEGQRGPRPPVLDESEIYSD